MIAGLIITENGDIETFGKIVNGRKLAQALETALTQVIEQEKAASVAFLTPEELESGLQKALLAKRATEDQKVGE